MSLPLTYPDIVCLNDLDPFASETTSALQTLSQDILHLLIELPGSNPDDVDRGIGIMQYLNCTEVQFRSLPGIIDAQVQRDTRVTSSKASIQAQPDGTWIVGIDARVGTSIIPLEYGVSAALGVTPL